MRLGGRQVTGEMLFLSIQVCGVLFAFREEILTIHFFVKLSSFFVNLSNNLLLIGFSCTHQCYLEHIFSPNPGNYYYR